MTALENYIDRLKFRLAMQRDCTASSQQIKKTNCKNESLVLKISGVTKRKQKINYKLRLRTGKI